MDGHYLISISRPKCDHNLFNKQTIWSDLGNRKSSRLCGDWYFSKIDRYNKSASTSDQYQKNVADLALSIETQGLFSPILVVDNGENVSPRFELIAGQRRMLAHREHLVKKDAEKFGKIGAFRYKPTMEDWEKKAISINAQYIPSYNNLGRCYYIDYDRESAFINFKKGIKKPIH